MIGVSVVSPIFDEVALEGPISVSAFWFLYWAICVPLNALAWFVMLPGRAIIRRVPEPTGLRRSLRVAAVSLVTLYWIAAILGWVWLLGNS